MRNDIPREVYAYFRRYVIVKHIPRYVYMFMSAGGWLSFRNKSLFMPVAN